MSVAESRRALIAGATGLVGRSLLAGLLDEPAYGVVHALLRQPHLARRRGATRCVVVSALGADTGSRFFYSRVKGETEAALARLDYPSLTLLRPSLLDGKRSESRPGERAHSC